MYPGKGYSFAKLILIIVFLGISFRLSAQVDYRVPFKTRMGFTSDDIYHIRGDFTIFGNTNLTMTNYSDDGVNSFSNMSYVDFDDSPATFNSSSASLVFSGENGADPNCTDILYAGLYWSGRTQSDEMTFEFTKTEGFLDPVTVEEKVDILPQQEHPEYIRYSIQTHPEFYDGNVYYNPYFEIHPTNEGDFISLKFLNDTTVIYSINYSEYKPVENLKISIESGYIQATFTPLETTDGDMHYSIFGLNRNFTGDLQEFYDGNNAVLFKSSGSYRPVARYTTVFDKRKVKIKTPGSSEYQEITASGNAILYPGDDLKGIYVGYADVTELVKQSGAGEYTVADMALLEGMSDNTGMFGNWGIVVVYQNAKMNFRDVAVFDGYTFIEAWNNSNHEGELEIKGFGAVEEGPVNLKLGLMASEGDFATEGDFLELKDKDGNWTRLSHPRNSVNNFFNSSIYTPVKQADGSLKESPRYPKLKNNTGIDMVQWEVPNPNNQLITNNQSSVKFRYGTNQDLYTLYAFAFSVLSYVPELEAHNHIISINGNPPSEDSSVKPGEEVTIQVDIRNKGTEELNESQLIIPIPYNAVFVSAEIIPEGYGEVHFDPNLGIAGSIVWNMGDIPIPLSTQEIITSLKYTLKLTEDCFILANNSCEPMLSVDGSISGIGSITQQPFSKLSFINGYKDGECEGTPNFGSLEIPISGRAEFALTHCSGFELFTELDPGQLPIFCLQDPPTNLADIISPSKEGYQVFFYTDELGGNPLINYYVNTSQIGTETIWVSEGPEGSCTGLRIPLDLTVIPTSPAPYTQDLTFCMEDSSIPFFLASNPGYTLQFYPDNNPSSSPMDAPTSLDLSKPERYSIWVSQVKPGECESPREEISIYIEDCSLRPDINLSITSNVDNYLEAGEKVIFFITISNPGKVTLVDIFLQEYFSSKYWNISELEPGEKKTFEIHHTVTEDDVLNQSIFISGFTNAYDILGNHTFDDSFLDIPKVSYVPGFLDFSLDKYEIACGVGENGLGKIKLTWTTSQSGEFSLTDLESGINIKLGTYTNKTQISFDLPPGNYSLKISDAKNIPYTISPIVIENKDAVQFEVPETIQACTEYIWFPDLESGFLMALTAPDGSKVTKNQDGSFTLVQTGTYLATASIQDGSLCASSKPFDAIIQLPSEVELEIRPFCSEDSSTTVDILQNTNGLQINWFIINGSEKEEITLFENSSQLILSETGNYQVSIRDPEGCLIGLTDFQVQRSVTDPLHLNPLYSYCPDKNDFVEIDPGSRFETFNWMLEGEWVSSASVFVPTLPGRYFLEAIDPLGCSFFTEFEVEEKCQPEVVFPTAIYPSFENKWFEIYPDNLTDEIEVNIFNKWGQLLYHCKDVKIENENKSSCIWDGTFKGSEVPNGNYVVNIQVTNYKLNVVRTIKSSILVVN